MRTVERFTAAFARQCPCPQRVVRRAVRGTVASGASSRLPSHAFALGLAERPHHASRSSFPCPTLLAALSLRPFEPVGHRPEHVQRWRVLHPLWSEPLARAARPKGRTPSRRRRRRSQVSIRATSSASRPYGQLLNRYDAKSPGFCEVAHQDAERCVTRWPCVERFLCRTGPRVDTPHVPQ
jgi:hypothetical protein